MTEPAVAAPPVPWTLQAAVALVSVEALVEVLAVGERSELTTGLRAFLVLCLSLKWLFAWRALRLSAGATLGLLMLQGTTIVAAFGAVDLALPSRLALGGTAAVVTALLLASLHAFPSPTLPKT